MAQFFDAKVRKLREEVDSGLPDIGVSEALTFFHRMDGMNLDCQEGPPQTLASWVSPVKGSRQILANFQPVSLEEMRTIIAGLGPSSSVLDPLPTPVLQLVAEDLLPDITDLVNRSLAEGAVPEAWKIGIVTPLLKKAGADPSILKNFRPVSQLRLLARITEHIVTGQVQKHLEGQGILHDLQSGFRPGRGTELATADVREQLLWLADISHPAMLVLLDLSAAFDTVDHGLLLKRVEEVGCMSGSVLSWMGSFLEGRAQRVRSGSALSGETPLPFGVPQGSALSPLLFNLYMRPLATLLEACGLRFHMYADDTQLLVDLHHEAADRERVVPCLTLIREWMRQNKLCLNHDKTEILLFGAGGKTPSPSVPWPESWGVPPTPVIQYRDLGIRISHHLDGSAQAKSMVQACNYQLNGLSRLFPMLEWKQRLPLYHALVGSRLSYGLDFLLSATKRTVYKLQKVQNRAIRLILGLPRREHISKWRCFLKWLPIQAQLVLRTCLRIWKAQRQIGPVYSRRWITKLPSTRIRRPNQLGLLLIPKFRKSTKGGGTIARKGSSWWNSLPLRIRHMTSGPAFKGALKAHLLGLEMSKLQDDTLPNAPPACREQKGPSIDTVRQNPPYARADRVPQNPSQDLDSISLTPAGATPNGQIVGPTDLLQLGSTALSVHSGLPRGLASPPLPKRDNQRLWQQAILNKRLNIATGQYRPRTGA